MEAKYIAIFALLFIVAAVFITGSEGVPVHSELADQSNLVDSMVAPSAKMMGPRQGRQFGYGYPYGGYGGYGGMGLMGGYGGLGGSSSSAAAAAASSSSSGSGGMGFPYGK